MNTKVSKFAKLARALPLAFRFYSRILSGKPVGASLNVSERCPINCMCYWRKAQAERHGLQPNQIALINSRGRYDEMSDEDMIAFVERLKDSGILLLQLVGGEPYMRADLLPKLARVSPRTWLATAGSRPLVQLPRTTQFVSVDGADAQTHDLVRHKPGLFDQIVRNLKYAKDRGIGPIHLHMVINALNHTQVGRVVETFCLPGLAESVVYSTHTPVPGSQDSDLYLLKDQMHKVQEQIMHAKQHYPRYVSMSDSIISALSANRLNKRTVSSCPTSKHIRSFRADGRLIPQCIFGPGADCSGCGCFITTALESIIHARDLETARILARLIPLGQ